jgi:hypothetical protein
MSPTSIGDPKGRACRSDENSASYCRIEIATGIYFGFESKSRSVNEPGFLYLERMLMKKPLHAPPFLSLHALAAPRGDGLLPELVSLFSRQAYGADTSLSEGAPAPEGCGLDVESDQLNITQDQGAPRKIANRRD